MTLHDNCQIVFSELFSTIFGMYRIANFSKLFHSRRLCNSPKYNHDTSAPSNIIYPSWRFEVAEVAGSWKLEAGSFLSNEYFLNF
jgi:hypothetical protein